MSLPRAWRRVGLPVRRILSVSALVLLLAWSMAVLAAVVLTSGLNRDEHMYLAAAVLLGRGLPWADFAYLQTPYMPWVYQAALAWTDGQWVLLTGRVVKLVILVALAGMIVQLARRLSGSAALGVALFVLLAHNDLFREPLGAARNYDLATLLVLIAMWAALFTGRPLTRLAGFTAGLCLGLAIGVKLTYALTPLALLLAPSLRRGLSRPGRRTLLAAGLGVVVGLLPALGLAMQAGLDRAWFNNLGFHQTNTQWRLDAGFDRSMDLPSKLGEFLIMFLALPTFWLAACLLVSAALLLRARGWRRGLVAARSPAMAMALGLAVIGAPMVLIPTPVWPAYYAPLVTWLALVIAAVCGRLPTPSRRAVLIVVWIGVGLAIAHQSRDDLFRPPGYMLEGRPDRELVSDLRQPERWPAVRSRRAGEALRQAVPAELRDRPVATLSPVFALEAGMPIYPELATGPFAYRVGDLLPPGLRRRYHTTSPGAIIELLIAAPPAAVITGLENELDEPFDLYAHRAGYRLHDRLIPGLRVWIAPGE